jgi:hypothetical protein
MSEVVPGVMRCAKCKFTLIRTTLYLGNGTSGPGDNRTEPCPNGCGPLWPMTWRDQAQEYGERLEQMHEELMEARHNGQPAWLPIDTVPRDGTEVLLYQPHQVCGGTWSDRWLDDAPGGPGWDVAGESDPSHWQPLPASPDGG